MNEIRGLESSSSLRYARIRPSIGIGIAAWIVYSVLASLIQVHTGIPYADWFKSADDAWHTAVIPLSLGGLVWVLFTL
jgi:hypothetical protein